MIFGESGGGSKASCLYAMPSAAPFFNKASIESGPGIRMTPKEPAAQTTAMVLKELNINSKDWEKLLELPVSVLLDLQNKLPSLAPRPETTNKKRVSWNLLQELFLRSGGVLHCPTILSILLRLRYQKTSL
jgi:para-nitrobenzyl esterase